MSDDPNTNSMWIKHLFEGPVGAVVAACAGALIRGIVSPYRWSWVEFFINCVVASAFALWFAPGVADYYNLTDRGITSLCILLGIIVVPITRGILKLAIDFRDDPSRYLNTRNKSRRNKNGLKGDDEDV